jgi:hypothetical protein
MADDMTERLPRHVLLSIIAGVKPQSKSDRMTPADFKSMRAALGELNG